jgi:hypothetical protein
MNQMNWSEEAVFSIISKNGDYRFFEVIDNNVSVAQTKVYDPPKHLAYPDFEKYQNEKLVLLIEVKGYFGFFDNRANALAMKEKHFKQYLVVRRKENVPVQVVFVIKTETGKQYYWETLKNMSKMEYYKDIYHGEKYVFWNSDDFRTDVESLGC